MEPYRTALVLGYGRSGQAAERMLLSEGTRVAVLAEECDGAEAVLRDLAANPFNVCIVSPGFALDHPWVRAVHDAGIPLLSELELGWSRHRGKTIAVTGSNGKSTAVKWICETLQQAGYAAAIGGNYGTPACEVVLDHPGLEWLVLEVSSFQLETVDSFNADAAVLLNILPNHLDRHGSMDIYRRIKARIFGPSSLLTGGACLVPVDLLPEIREDLAGTDRQWITFGGTPAADYFFENGRVFHAGEVVADLSGTLFDRPVVGSCTAAAVVAATAACGIVPVAVERAAKAFKPLPHRLQRAGELNGVVYVNDSKATNLAATAAAVQACGRGIHLIAGGLSKETDYTFIKEILAERTASIYLVGQASRAMYQAWNGACRCVECGTLEEAFSSAKNTAKPGETILLSPGCASFDQFRNFEERGERFMALFRETTQGGGDAL